MSHYPAQILWQTAQQNRAQTAGSLGDLTTYRVAIRCSQLIAYCLLQMADATMAVLMAKRRELTPTLAGGQARIVRLRGDSKETCSHDLHQVIFARHHLMLGRRSDCAPVRMPEKHLKQPRFSYREKRIAHSICNEGQEAKSATCHLCFSSSSRWLDDAGRITNPGLQTRNPRTVRMRFASIQCGRRGNAAVSWSQGPCLGRTVWAAGCAVHSEREH